MARRANAGNAFAFLADMDEQPVEQVPKEPSKKQKKRAQRQAAAAGAPGPVPTPLPPLVLEAYTPFLQMPRDVLQKIGEVFDSPLPWIRFMLLTAKQVYARLHTNTSSESTITWKNAVLGGIHHLDLSQHYRLVDSRKQLRFAFHKFSAVASLDLSDCPNLANLEDLVQLERLAYLDVSGCYALYDLWGENPGKCAASFHPNLATTLKTLILNNCRHPTPIAEALSVAQQIEVLHLSYTVLNHIVLNHIAKHLPKTLRHLDISHSSFNAVSVRTQIRDPSTFLNYFRPLTKLVRFEAHGTTFPLRADARFSYVFQSDWPLIEVLAFTPLKHVGSAPVLGKLSALRSLTLNPGTPTNGFFKHLRNLANLIELRLTIQLIQWGQELANLSRLDRLRVLHITPALVGGAPFFASGNAWPLVAQKSVKDSLPKLGQLRKLQLTAHWDFGAMFEDNTLGDHLPHLQDVTIRIRAPGKFEWLAAFAGAPVTRLRIKHLTFSNSYENRNAELPGFPALHAALTVFTSLQIFHLHHYVFAHQYEERLKEVDEFNIAARVEVLMAAEASKLLQTLPSLRSVNMIVPKASKAVAETGEFNAHISDLTGDKRYIGVMCP